MIIAQFYTRMYSPVITILGDLWGLYLDYKYEHDWVLLALNLQV